MTKVKIVGQGNELFDYQRVKDAVINLGGKYYWKHDTTNLVRVPVAPKRFRLFRKESGLLVKAHDGMVIRRSDAIITEDGVVLNPYSPDVIYVNGKPTLKQWCVVINDQYYLRSDPQLVMTRSGQYALRASCIQLAPRYYGENVWEVNTPEVVETDRGDFALRSDTRKVITPTGSNIGEYELAYMLRNDITRDYYGEVLYDFKDHSNPQLGRYEYGYALSSVVTVVELVGNSCRVLKAQADAWRAKVAELELAVRVKRLEKALEICNSNYDDLDETENKVDPTVFNENYQTWPGKSELFGRRKNFIDGINLKRTGGLGYSFGVEIETSAGLLNSRHADSLGLLAVGDRSIGSAEYVTGVLHGTKGIDALERICKHLARYCAVDNRCGVHVHVGNAPLTNINAPQISFNRYFAMAAIKLGAMLEEEFYLMMPPSRSPHNRHCHSILRYRDINESNWRERLGYYVFGPEENWRRTPDYDQYKYGARYNKGTRLSSWCGGRYKWLNLVRAYSNVPAGTETIEFRIFSASTNFEKIYNAVLISLAFTHLCNNHYQFIMNAYSLTMDDVIQMAYGENHPEIASQVINYINARKQKFNKKNIYKFYPVEFNTINNAATTHPNNLVTPSPTVVAAPVTNDNLARFIEETSVDWL